MLTVSDAARREIISHFGLPDNRVRCIYPGVDFTARRRSMRGRRRASRWCCSSGSVFNRRHIPDLIRAFKPIARRHAAARLEIVGDNRTLSARGSAGHRAQRRGIAAHVSIRPYVSDDELAELYGRARAFALLVRVRGIRPSAARSARLGRSVGAARHGRRPRGLRRRGAVRRERRYRRHDRGARTACCSTRTCAQRVLRRGPAVLARYSWTRAAAETLAALEAAA